MQQPLIQQGWLRVLLFVIVYVLLLAVTAIAAGFLVVLLPGNTIPFVYLGLFVQVMVGAGLVFLFRKMFDKATVKSLGLPIKNHSSEALIGLVSGVYLCHIIAVVLWLMQLLEWTLDESSLFSLLPSLLLLFLVAFVEELVFRGYILNNLLQSLNQKNALLLSALIFAAAHSWNPEFNLTAFVNILLAGLLLGVNYIFSRNLWFGILLHLSWNFVQAPVLGFKVSGLELPSLFEQNIKGSILLTGGEFGLEASWLTALAFGIMIPIFYLLFQKKYKTPSA
jgi:membrane protease YdiL (CAAX protease family)